MPLEPRPEIKNLKVCHHGGKNYAELQAIGIAPEAILDFSVCTNPFMPPQAIKELHIGSAAIEQYPDTEATQLKRILSQKLSISPDTILVGSGSTELIRLIAFAYFRHGDSILIWEPTYGEYEIISKITGAKPRKQWMKAEDSFALQTEKAVDFIKQYQPRAVFICNPNNPTGKYLSYQEIEMVLDAMDDGLLILDQAYIAFVEASRSSVNLISRGNIIIVRSMTKDYGLTGLRLGYTIASREITDTLRRVCPPWNVNAIAQKAGAMVLEDDGYLEQTMGKIKEAKLYLTSELSRLGFQPLPSDTHYFLVEVGNARLFRSALLKYGIQVRDCTSFGLPEYIRISTRTLPECKRLIAAIRKLKNKGEIDVGK